jgi:hypothetical protein
MKTISKTSGTKLRLSKKLNKRSGLRNHKERIKQLIVKPPINETSD